MIEGALEPFGDVHSHGCDAAGLVAAQPVGRACAPQAAPKPGRPDRAAARWRRCPCAAQPEPAPLPPPPPPLWQVHQAQTLLNYINDVGREGLSPADYDPAGLIAAMRSGDPMVLAQAATDRFNKLSSDLALGHVRGDARIGWHVVDKDIDDVRQRQLLEAALVTNRIPEVLNSLLPTHPQYGALRTALSIAPRTERPEDQQDPAQHGPVALAAARPWREIYHRQRARHSMRRWSKMA